MQIQGLLLFALLFTACAGNTSNGNPAIMNAKGKTLQERIQVPAGYKRTDASQGSFAEYLRNVALKPNGSLVHYYNGAVKTNENVYVAVLAMDPGKRDLMQCADAVMRLRAEYLYSTGQADQIHFTFTNGFRADYSKWKEGYRISVHGNKAQWVKMANASTSYASFWSYLEVVFSYCGSLSLSKELKHIAYKDLLPGDVLIRGGTPGHAEIVMDVAQNAKGEKIYLLAQSYMPAQEIQVLVNPVNASLNPWYILNATDENIITPQYNFKTTEVMRFE